MDEHATIFWVQHRRAYALCYDADLDNLPPLPDAPRKKKKNPRAHRYFPYRLYPVKKPYTGYAMYITYNPDSSIYERDEHGKVSRTAAVSEIWLSKMILQFDQAFPSGLTPDMIENSWYLKRAHRPASTGLYIWKH